MRISFCLQILKFKLHYSKWNSLVSLKAVFYDTEEVWIFFFLFVNLLMGAYLK